MPGSFPWEITDFAHGDSSDRGLVSERRLNRAGGTTATVLASSVMFTADAVLRGGFMTQALPCK